LKKQPNLKRTIHENGGISGVAFFLEQEFQNKGYKTERFTIENLPFGFLLKDKNIKNIILSKIYLFLSVFYYSIFGSIVLYFKHKHKDKIIICHNDVLIGDIYINHGLHKSLLEQNGYIKMFLKNPLHLFLYLREEFRHRFSRHKVVIAFSKDDAKELRSLYPTKSKIIILPNGIDTAKYFQDTSLREKYRLINKAKNDFIMIFIGHEFERKGLKYIIDSLPYLDKKVKLWVIGGNTSMINQYQQISKKLGVENRITFFGYRKDINELLNASDVMILASNIEPWGLVGLEAMSTGTPFISTKTHGAKEYLEDGVNGLFIEKNGKDIADKVTFLMKDNDTYIKMCKNARKTAESLSWDKIADRYIEIINSILKEKNA
jgi:glycosyltransferase involved in cell wall biosynthesis